METYCLFCGTGKSDQLLSLVRSAFGCEALPLKTVQHTYKQGRMRDQIRELLPGYIFLYSEQPINLDQLSSLPDMARPLRSDAEGGYELQGADRAFALLMREKDGILGKTPVTQEHDRLFLRDKVFADLRSSILKVDHRATRMLIEIPFATRAIRTWLEYEIVERR